MLPNTSIAEAEATLGRGLTGMEVLWFRYSAGVSDFALNGHNVVFLLIVYTLAPLPLITLIELMNPKAIDKYKLQPKAQSPKSSYLYAAVGIRTSLPLPSATEVVSQLAVYLLIEDYFNYWLHRLLHRKWAYDLIHHVHHEFTAPIGFAAPYAHWAEVLILGLPAFMGPALVPGHIVTFWLWFVIRYVEAIETHCGYDFPHMPTKFIPFYGGAEYHDYHHYVGGQSQSNFASVFTYCDYIYGTDKGYKYQKEHLRKLREQWKYDELDSETNGKLD